MVCFNICYGSKANIHILILSGQGSSLPSKRETLAQRWFTVGPPFTTLAQRWANILCLLGIILTYKDGPHADRVKYDQ